MFTTNLKEAFATDANDADRGSLVETVLLIAGFAVVAILVVTWIGNAISGQAADVADCISGSNSYAGSSTAEEACSGSENSDKAAEKNHDSSGWEDRFGG